MCNGQAGGWGEAISECVGSGTAAGISNVSKNVVGDETTVGGSEEVRVSNKGARRIVEGVQCCDGGAEWDANVLRRAENAPGEMIQLAGETVIIDDQAVTFALEEIRVNGRRKIDIEDFVRFDEQIAIHADRDGGVGNDGLNSKRDTLSDV